MLSKATTLMHPIEAQNHKSNGFFPTDTNSMELIVNAIRPNESTVNVLDPCCGEGEALIQFQSIFKNAQCHGVELDHERYLKAKNVIDNTYYGDMYDMSFQRSGYDVLFLNPPYGNDLTDRFQGDRVKRLEHKFLVNTFSALKADGVLAYIIPASSLDTETAKWILSRFKSVSVRKAAVDRFKQVIIMGVKLKHQRSVNAKMITTLLEQLEGNLSTNRELYDTPSSKGVAKATINRLNSVNVTELAAENSGQWKYFDVMFVDSETSDFKKPLHKVSDWHLALLVTSGAIDGVIDNGQQKLLVKGSTAKYKKKETSQESSNDCESGGTTIIKMKERFVAQIKAFDIDTESPNFGDLITIK